MKNPEKLIKSMPDGYITKVEFCELCNISESTGYKLIKNKKMIFEKCRDGLLHFYKIPLSEVERYKREKAQKGIFSEIEFKKIQLYYEKKLFCYSDVIEAQDIREITGYGKEAIRKWINNERILGIVVKNRFKVAKDDLFDFLVSPYYQNINRKSSVHKADIRQIQLI